MISNFSNYISPSISMLAWHLRLKKLPSLLKIPEFVLTFSQADFKRNKKPFITINFYY